MPATQCLGLVVRSEDIQAAQALEDLVSSCTLGKQHKVKSFKICINREAVRILWKRVSKESLIKIATSYLTIAIQICPDKIAWAGIRLNRIAGFVFMI